MNNRVTRISIILVLVLANFGYAQELPVETDDYQRGVDAFAEGDYTAAADIWLTEAYEGSDDAQFNIGVLFLEGKGVARDRNEAVFWFTRAAESGHMEAQYNLGYLYFENKDDPELMKKGLELWRRAAVQGFSIAQFNYGGALFYGIGEEKNLSAAKFWIEQSARAGEGVAIDFLETHAQAFAHLNTSKTRSVTADHVSESVDEESLATYHSALDSQNNDQAVSGAGESEAEPAEQVVEKLTIDEYVQRLDTDSIVLSASDNSAQARSQTGRKIRRVNRRGMQLLKSPDTDAEPLFNISRDTLVLVNSEENGWARISIPGGLPVWLPESAITVKNSKVIVNKDGVVMRLLPAENPQNHEFGKLQKEQVLNFLEVDGQWVRALAPQSVSAWVLLSDLDSVIASDALDREWLKQQRKLHTLFYKYQ